MGLYYLGLGMSVLLNWSYEARFSVLAIVQLLICLFKSWVISKPAEMLDHGA